MFKKIKKYLSDKWDSVKAWFKYSETIFVARLEAFTGLLVAAVEGFDWSAITSLDFTNAVARTQALWIGGLVFLKGITGEWLRRRNATDLGK